MISLEKELEHSLIAEKEREQKNIRKQLGVWGMILLLALLVLFGNLIGTSHTNAKYKANISGAADRARVAAVGGAVSIKSSPIYIDAIVGSWSDCYFFEITNQENASSKVSEVTLDYKIDVKMEAPAGLTFQIVPDGTTTNHCNTATSVSPSGAARIFSVSGGVFPVNRTVQTHSYKVQAQWTDKPADYAGQPVTIMITVEATQKD